LTSSVRPHPARVLAAGVAVALLLLTGACGAGSEENGAAEGKEVHATPMAQASATPAGAKLVHVKVTRDSIDPQGEKLEVKKGQPVVLDIDAEVAGELHVHSSPEQHIEYPAGKSQASLTIDRPGIIEVESHTLDKLVLQLEVR
jgi:hypothetical protein